MEVVGDLLARDRRSRETALVTASGSERTYHDLITNAYKAANVLRHLGAREGSTVAIDPSPGVQPVLAFLGAARLGARVRFDPARGLAAGDRVVLVAAEDEGTFEPSPGTNLAVYGGPPERPGTTHWEQELWSENPGTPPASVGPTDPLFCSTVDPAGDSESVEITHAAALSTAGRIVEDCGLTADSRIVLRTTFAEPGTVVSSVVAASVVGGAVVLTDGSAEDGPPRGDLAVAADPDDGGPTSVPEPQRIAPPAVFE